MAGIRFDISTNTNQAVAGIEKVTKSLQKMPNASNQATNSLMNLSRVAQDAPYGFIGIANNINPLLESFQRLKATTGTTGGAMKALGSSLMGPAGVGLAVGVVSSLLVTFGDRLFGAGKAAKEASEKAKQLRDSIQGIFENAGKEAANVNLLISVLKNETETRERKLSAIKQLQQIQPEVFASLKLEGDTVNGLDSAYQQYLANLQSVIKVKVRQSQLENLITKQLQLQDKVIGDQLIIDKPFLASAIPGEREKITKSLINQVSAAKIELQNLQSEINNILKDIQSNTQGIELKPPPVTKTTVSKKDNIVPLLGLGDSDQALFSSIDRIFSKIQDRVNFRLKNLFNQKKGFDITGGSAKEKGLIPDETIKATQEQLQFLSQAIGSVLQPAFSGLFDAFEEGGNVIKSFFDGFVDGIKRMIEQLLATAAISGILSLILPNAGGFGKIFSGLIGLPGRAAGGPVAAGRPVIVGEAGRELFIPSTSGRIVPTNGLGGLAGAAMQMVSVTVNGQISGRTIELVQTRQQRYRLGNG